MEEYSRGGGREAAWATLTRDDGRPQADRGKSSQTTDTPSRGPPRAYGPFLKYPVVCLALFAILIPLSAGAQTYYYVEPYPGEAASISSTNATCDGTEFGAIRYNTGNSSFEGCNGSAWGPLVAGGSATLNGITAATANNVPINSLAYTIGWNWNSLLTGNGLTLGSTSLTSGSILFVSSSSASATGAAINAALSAAGNTGAAINATNASTGTAYGVKATMSSNAGGAAIFGFDTSGDSSGVEGENSSTTGGAVAVYGVETGATGNTDGGYFSDVSTTAGAAGVYGTITGTNNLGYAVYGINNPATNTTANWGGYFETTSTGAAFGVEGKASGGTNTGIGVYGLNTSSGLAYGVRGDNTTSGNTGAGVLGTNVTTGINFGVEGSNTSVTAGAAGVYGQMTGANNAGYAVYGANTGTTNTGYGGYFTNTGGGIGLGVNGPFTMPIGNDTTTGTTIYKLAKLNGAASAKAIIPLTTDTSGIIGIVQGGAGTTLSAQISYGGTATCVFDGATTAGDYVQISSITAGDCHDTGSATPPASGEIIGIVGSTNGAGGNFAMLVNLQNAVGGAGATTLNAITAATASQGGINNVANTIVWKWALGGGGGTAFTFGEQVAATSGGKILNVATIAGSTAVPLTITNGGASKIAENYTAGGLAFAGTAVLTYPWQTAGPGWDTTSFAVGPNALISETANSENNTAVGYDALAANTSGIQNVAMGYMALAAGTTGNDNVAIGNTAMDTGVVTGQGNIAIGSSSNAGNNTIGVLANLTSGNDNIGMGERSLQNDLTGSDNVAIGGYTLQQNTASFNTALGYSALSGNTTGTGNIAIGADAMDNATVTGNNNIAIGSESGSNASLSPLAALTSGNYNIAIGGAYTLHNTSTGVDNTALGYQAGNAVDTGTDNTLVGYTAGNLIHSATGNFNIIVGEGGNITTGASNILIGNSLTGTTNTSSNQLDIGDLITGTIGSSDVGINTTTYEGAGLTLGKTSSLYMMGSTSGYIGFTANATSGSQAYTLPSGYPGASGYVLSSTTGGAMSWVANGGGAIGSPTQIAFNNAGTESGDAGLIYTVGTATLTATNVSASTKVSLGVTAGAAAPTGLALADLSGDSISSPTNGQVLTYNGTSWVNSTASGGSGTLNSITAATAGNSIDSLNFAQTWKWSTLSTGTGLSLGSAGLTSGSILYVSSSSTSATGAAISAALSGAGNTGAAINATNASTTGGAVGVYGAQTGGGAVANYGVEGTTNATGAAYGVYGSETGASNTGYGVYGVNSGTTNTGAGGYFTNTGGGYALITGAGKAGIGVAAPLAGLDVQTGMIAASGFAYGLRQQQTLTAVANGDTLYGLYLNTTYTNGAFTGLSNIDIGINGTGSTPTTTPREILVDRNATAAKAGYNLLVGAGGGTVGGNNLNGGDLILSGGTATGTGSSNISLRVAGGGVLGASDRAPVEVMKISGGTGTFTAYNVQWGANSASASGGAATAWGYFTQASGLGSTAWGAYSTAPGQYSTAFGGAATAGGVAYGDYSTVIGSAQTGTSPSTGGTASVAIGATSTVCTAGSTCPKVSGAGAVGIFMGNNTASPYATLSAPSVFGVIGGKVYINPNTSPGTVAASNVRAALDVGNATDAIVLPNGGTAVRPVASNGMLRYNSDNNVLEYAASGTWTTVGTTSAATPGGANTNIEFNNSGSFAGNSQLTWTTGTSTLAVVGAANVSGNVTVGNYAILTPQSALGAPTALKLATLGDTSVSSPTNGQCLTYNSGSAVWTNGSCSSGSGAVLTVTRQVFTTSTVGTAYTTTYTPHAGLLYATVEVVGPGGGGGAVNSGAAAKVDCGGGGGAGGYVRATLTGSLISSAAPITITVAAGGLGGAAGPHSGAASVTPSSSFVGTGINLVATSGSGGTFIAPANLIIAAGGVGGVGSGGDVNSNGGAGGTCMGIETTVPAYSTVSGAGGNSFLGNGGVAVGENAAITTSAGTGAGNASGTAAASATGYGGGGSGAAAVTTGAAAAGGNGGDGIVIVTEYNSM